MFKYSRFPIDEDEEMEDDVGNHGSKSDFGSEIKANIRVEAGEAGDEASESRNEAKESGYERNGFRNEIREAGDGGRDSTSGCGSTNETKAARRIDTALKEDFGKRIVEEVCARGIRGIDQEPNRFQLVVFLDKGDWVSAG
ncbi:hypothetical protein EWM64_g8543 [Hericium alpestre]|uniref:Uncharacterized protein n=1 Tax=Hericium alpestre TaxID=135208 RepID=A0A4Y9ZN22_9AGAM|nr:hypothetical protein EWM64_g8543 [Hericium alpestre]